MDYLVYILELNQGFCEQFQASLPQKPCSEKKFSKLLRQALEKEKLEEYHGLIMEKACVSDSSPTGQRKFIKEYREVRKFCDQGVSILFCDAMHLVHNTVSSYCWLPKGKTCYEQSNSGRKRLNIFGAFDIERFELHFDADESNCNHDSTLRFFKKLESSIPPDIHTIFVILDNAAYHRHPELKEFFENSRIFPWFLPPYCPNLNLIERFWKFAKKHLVVNTFEEKYKTFRANLFQLLGCLDPHMEELKILKLLESTFEKLFFC